MKTKTMYGRGQYGTRSRRRTGVGPGCLLAVVGAPVAVLAWSPYAADKVTGGFEDQGRDLSVLVVDLPLVALGGALVPLAAWAVAKRWLGRSWLAVVVAAAVFALGLWGLLAWWA